MSKQQVKSLYQYGAAALFSLVFAANSFANEGLENPNSAMPSNQPTTNQVAQSLTSEALKDLSQESIDRNDFFKSTFDFPLEGPKGDVKITSRDFTREYERQAREAEEARRGQGDRRCHQGQDDRRAPQGQDDRRGHQGQDERGNSQAEQGDVRSFTYALKTPYFITENQELMLDVLELTELYEPNLLVTLKDDILSLTFTHLYDTSKKIEAAPAPATTEDQANTDPSAETTAAAPANAPAQPETAKEMLEFAFNKEVYTLVIDLDKDAQAGLLSHTVYQPIIEQREAKANLPAPTTFILDEAKSYKDKNVSLNAPAEIIENFVFVPLSIMTFFNEIVVKEEHSYFASNKLATRENIEKLSKIKNITKEIEKAPEFLSRENFELIYAMIGPAGTAIVVLVFVATYLALKNFYYLTFVWMQFRRKFRKYDDECTMLDAEIESKNPLIQLIKEITSLKIKDPTALRIEVAFIFQRNLEMVVQDLSYIRLISVISPLLGLLGTVLGMVDVFQAIAESASPDPAELASGIWSALLTTILGLSVAVPTLIVYYYLLLKFKRYQNRAVTYSLRINEECGEHMKA